MDFNSITLNPDILNSYNSRCSLEIVCSRCGESFYTLVKYLRRKLKCGVSGFYCSNRCAARTVDKLSYSCLTCGSKVIRRKTQVESSGLVFCSKSCAATYNNKGKQRHKPKPRVCKGCSSIYYKVGRSSYTYCGACLDLFDLEKQKLIEMSKTLSPRLAGLKCSSCGERFSFVLEKTSHHRCQKCYVPLAQRFERQRMAHQMMTLANYHQKLSVRGKHPSWRNAHLRNFARSWNKELAASPCMNCGYSKHVELAHIRSVSSFSLDATLGEINSALNLLALCPNCHWEFDNGFLSLDDISPGK